MGWKVAVELFRSAASREVEVLPSQRLTPDLAEPISRAEHVVFLDITHGGIPGELHSEEIFPSEGNATFSHHLDPPALLSVARDLYGVYPQAYLLTICGRRFEAGDTLSSEVEHQIPALKAKVRDLTTELLGRCALHV
jgi:hydrogenase maturation protease